MELIRDFKKLNKHDAVIAGGKGTSLFLGGRKSP